MRNKGYAALILFLLSFIPVSTIACGDFPVISSTSDDGTSFGLFVSREQIEATQRWNPEMGEPPLGVFEAYRLALEWARGHYVRYDDVQINKISLQPYRCSVVQDRWFYVLDLVPIIDGNSLWGGGNWAAVLMDGSVIGSREFEDRRW